MIVYCFHVILHDPDHPDQLRIDLSSNSPQKLIQIVEYCPKTEPQTFGKTDFNTFVKSQTFIMGLEETAWGKMTVMTVGSFHVFAKVCTLTCVLQIKIQVFPETSICIFFVSAIYFLLEDRYVRRFFE